MEQELYHHGILGMKWGIRRYQNKDGSLTAAGRKRYGSKEALEVDKQLENVSDLNKALIKNRKMQLTDPSINPASSIVIARAKNNARQTVLNVFESHQPELKAKRDESYELKSKRTELINNAYQQWVKKTGVSDDADRFFDSDIYKDKKLIDKIAGIDSRLDSLKNEINILGEKACDEILGKIGNEKVNTSYLRNGATKKKQILRLISTYEYAWQI